FLSALGMALVLMKNYDPFRAPQHFKIVDLLKKFDKTFGATGRNYGSVAGDRTQADIAKRRSDRWNFLFIAGMWFQDLFNYDFRRTEMCIIPYGTQEGEISFCAYNTGIGWRNILEKMHQNATVSQWYKKHGKHTVYANGKGVPMDNAEHQLNINEEHASRVRVKGDGPQNAHDEEIMRRKMMQQQLLGTKLYQIREDKKPETSSVGGD